MENAAMKVFENEQFGKVRVVSKGGEPWFVAGMSQNGWDMQSLKMPCPLMWIGRTKPLP